MTTQTLRTNSLPLIRPAWTPATIALMVAGFIVFFPLGLAMLAYIIWGERFQAWRDNGGSLRDAANMTFNANRTSGRCASNRSGFAAHAARTGNVAFDDWRDGELARLDEERRKLDAMREEFDAYSRDLRRAKDQDEFDRFMGARSAASKTKKGTSPDVIDE